MKWFLPTLAIFLCAAVMAVEQPEGYRTDNYDDTVPDSLTGATRVAAVDVRRLQKQDDAVIVDVIPEIRQPDVIPEGQTWFPVPHKGLAGALWLPDTGYGVLSPVTESYFRDHLAEATRGDMNHPLVFYCRADCWMSWNAAKRALTYGFTSVYWFADGIDDWMFEGFETDVLTPADGRRH